MGAREREKNSDIFGGPAEGTGSGAGGQGPGGPGPGEEGGEGVRSRGVGARVAWNLFMPKVEQLLVNKLMRWKTTS